MCVNGKVSYNNHSFIYGKMHKNIINFKGKIAIGQIYVNTKILI